MAESTSTATAPSGGPGAKGSSATWWKSLTSRKKCKETLSASPGGPTELLYSQPSTSDSRENQPSIVSSGSRRNLKISRSGRFKEKRKARVTLLAESPQKLFEEGGGGTSSSTSAHPSEETPCQ